MPAAAVDTKRKYDVGHGSPAPELTRIPGVTQVSGPHESFLEAIYFDTGNTALAARGISLGRRTGGLDEGWFLRLPPGPDGRRELQAPLGQPHSVPLELHHHLEAYTRGRKLSPLARLSTRRTAHGLYGQDGVHLADFTDDRTHATGLRGAAEVHGAAEVRGAAGDAHWRTWEIELLHGTGQLLEGAADVLSAAGATPAKAQSDLARALAGALGGAPPAARYTRPPKPRRKGPVLDVFRSCLDTQINELIASDAGVRAGTDDAVHAMRSAARRIRSALRTYRTLLAEDEATRLGLEVKWLGRLLGRPRDAEVVRERILADLAALPKGRGAGPCRAPVEHELDTVYNAGYQRLLKALDSRRYFDLLAALEEFREHPPVKAKAGGPARKVTARLLNKAAHRLEQTQRKARKGAAGADQDAALHRIRKEARRLRHAAETVSEIHGKRAGRIEKAAHGIQQILGEHQDTVVARELLQRLVADPATPATVRAVYKEIITAEARNAAETVASYRKANKKSRSLRLD